MDRTKDVVTIHRTDEGAWAWTLYHPITTSETFDGFGDTLAAVGEELGEVVPLAYDNPEPFAVGGILVVIDRDARIALVTESENTVEAETHEATPS